MDKVNFLMCLKEFTEGAVSELMLPTRVQSESDAPAERAADVYLMQVPDGSAAKKYCPYICHTIITSEDVQPAGQQPESLVTVRTIFGVYHEQDDAGGLALLNLMERLRIALLRKRVIGRRYRLATGEKLETLIYPDNLKPYYVGEMMSVWQLPAIREEVVK